MSPTQNQPEKFILSSEEIRALLPGINLSLSSEQPNASWVSTEPEFMARVCESGGLSWPLLLQASSVPHLTLPLCEQKVAALTREAIYAATVSSFSKSYYLAYLDKKAELSLRYQRIIGSRRIGQLGDAERRNFFDHLVEQARAFGATPQYEKVLEMGRKVQERAAHREASAGFKPRIRVVAPPCLSATLCDSKSLARRAPSEA